MYVQGDNPWADPYVVNAIIFSAMLLVLGAAVVGALCCATCGSQKACARGGGCIPGHTCKKGDRCCGGKSTCYESVCVVEAGCCTKGQPCVCTKVEWCWNPPKWAQQVPHILFAASAVLVAALFVVAWSGFAVNVVQNNEIAKLSAALSSFDDWQAAADGTLASTRNQTDAVVDAIDATVNTALYFDVSNDPGNQLHELKSLVLTSLWTTKAYVEDTAVHVTALRSLTVATLGGLIAEEVLDWQDFLEQANAVRNAFVMATWAALLALAAFNLISAAIFRWKTDLYQRKLAWCASLMGGFYMLALVVMFFVSCMMLLFTKASTDFCQPDAVDQNFRSFGSINASSGNNTNDYLLSYYVDCDQQATAGTPTIGGAVANPTNADAQRVTTAFTAALGALATMHEEVEREYAAIDSSYAELRGQAKADFRATYVEATEAIKSIDYPIFVLQSAIDEMHATFYGNKTTQGYDAGALSVLQCYQINVRYRAAMNQLCGKVYPTVGATFELMMAATILMILMDVCRRLLRPTQAQPPEWSKDDDEVEGLMPLRQRLMSAVSFYNQDSSDEDQDGDGAGNRPLTILEDQEGAGAGAGVGAGDAGAGADSVGVGGADTEEGPVAGSIGALLKAKPPGVGHVALSPVRGSPRKQGGAGAVGMAPAGFAAASSLPPPNMGGSRAAAISGMSEGLPPPAAVIMAATAPVGDGGSGNGDGNGEGGGGSCSSSSSMSTIGGGNDGKGDADVGSVEAAVGAAVPLTKAEKKAASKAEKVASKAAKAEAKAAAKKSKADDKKAKKGGGGAVGQVAPAPEDESAAGAAVSGVAAAINRPMTAPAPAEKEVKIGSVDGDFLSAWAGGLGATVDPPPAAVAADDDTSTDVPPGSAAGGVAETSVDVAKDAATAGVAKEADGGGPVV